jgi:rhodanese-related sulfurtransferase
MLMPLAAVKTIDRDELRAALAAGKVKLVMALSEWAFQAKHIPGSLHFNSAAELMAVLGKDEDIVVYCSDVNCHASVALYQNLLEHGYTHVRRYSGGLIDWEAAGLPLEGEWITGKSASD